MSETISCPSCKRLLQVPEDLKGQTVRCPSCSNTFTASTEPPPPIAPPPLPETAVHNEPEQPRRRAAPRDDDYDDRDDDDYPRRRRRRRLDCEPHRGATILVFGILGFVICGIIFGPLAWAMGSSDLRKIREGQMDPEGEGMTKAGMICGIIATILNIACIGFYAIIFIAGAAGGRFK